MGRRRKRSWRSTTGKCFISMHKASALPIASLCCLLLCPSSCCCLPRTNTSRLSRFSIYVRFATSWCLLSRPIVLNISLLSVMTTLSWSLNALRFPCTLSSSASNRLTNLVCERNAPSNSTLSFSTSICTSRACFFSILFIAASCRFR